MESFPIAPAAARALWGVSALLIVILVPVTILVGRTVMASRTATFEVSRAGLRLRGDWYGRTIPAAQLRASGVRRVDFAADPGLRPRWRTLGTGLPGYQSGWFRLADGQKALVYLTDRGRAVYIPTTEGYGILLSPMDPGGFVSAIRSMAGETIADRPSLEGRLP